MPGRIFALKIILLIILKTRWTHSPNLTSKTFITFIKNYVLNRLKWADCSSPFHFLEVVFLKLSNPALTVEVEFCLSGPRPVHAHGQCGIVLHLVKFTIKGMVLAQVPGRIFALKSFILLTILKTRWTHSPNLTIMVYRIGVHAILLGQMSGRNIAPKTHQRDMPFMVLCG
jgi:hypothetical protein